MGTMDTLAGSSSPATSAVDARSPSNVALRSFSSSAATMTGTARRRKPGRSLRTSAAPTVVAPASHPSVWHSESDLTYDWILRSKCE